CREAVQALVRRGAEIVEITIPHMRAMRIAHATKIMTEFALLWDAKFHNRSVALEPNTAITVALGKTLSAAEVIAGQRVRTVALNFFRDLFAAERLSFIANPTIGVRVPKLPESARGVGESNNALVIKVLK